MGARGPVPNASEDLARPRERRGGAETRPITKGTRRAVTIPAPDAEWHPAARAIWDAMQTSGQADFYQDTDWAIAHSLMDDISHFKKSYKRSGQMLQTIMSALTSLLLTEGDRRRIGLELAVPETGEDDEADAIQESYQQELGIATVTDISTKR